MTRSLAFAVAPCAAFRSPSLSLVAIPHSPPPFCIQSDGTCYHATTNALYQSKQPYEDQEEEDDFFLQQELARIESLDTALIDTQDEIDDDDDDEWTALHDLSDLEFPFDELQELEQQQTLFMPLTPKSAETLEQALRQGVVPADAGVGSASLAGDFGFDPLHLANEDYIGHVQNWIIHLLPGGDNDNDVPQEEQNRPRALILRDYREAEIRHGRLAMLAAVFWPVQELLDRFFLEEDFGSVVGNLTRGGITLPYIPLAMTAIMLLLGYLDIFRQEVKTTEQLGEAFEPGDCFWDPLSMLKGAPASMKRNMQERELFNARLSMLAIAVYVWEEVRRGQPIISIPGNELLFEPFYQVPYIQEWLDSVFG